MKILSSVTWQKIVVTVIAVLFGVQVRAAEFTVVSAAAVQVPVTELAMQFERMTGHRVRFEFATGGGVDDKMRDGGGADIVINDAMRLAKLISTHIIATTPVHALGVVQIGVAVRKGGRRPDLASVETFRTALLEAQSIAYGDPQKNATTGVHFKKVLEQLGLTDAIRPIELLAPNGLAVMRMVSSGKAEIGITQISEILHIQPDSLVGPLPTELQLSTTYAVAFGKSRTAAPAQQFVDLLLGAEGRARFVQAGFR
jgi:molybdate transport system substrate-binding protein